MSASVTWDGLERFKEELRKLPRDLADEAQGIVLEAAEEASSDIAAAYPARTGNLRAGLRVRTLTAGQYGAAAEVRNRAPHAWLFEYGTQARHTRIGANRGSMPPGNVFVPRTVRQRRTMYQRLMAMMERSGLEVSGHA